MESHPNALEYVGICFFLLLLAWLLGVGVEG
jgi:hypothetical protein